MFMDGRDQGPVYNVDSPSLRKHRRGGTDRQAYGQAVVNAVLAAQRAQLVRVAGMRANPYCASKSKHTTGAAILKAVAGQHAAALAACPGVERRARKPEVWQSMYEAAMTEKRSNQERKGSV